MSNALVDAQSFHRRRFRWRGAIGVVLLVPTAAVTILSPPLVPRESLAHVALETLAWMAFVAGASFRFWATLYIGGRKERDLVTDGPYSLCRHPLYLGSLLLGISAGLFLESLLFLTAIAVVSAVYARATIPVEEDVLRARHGVRYDFYINNVPRLVPRRHRISTPGAITVDVHRLWLECARASRWICLPIVGAVFSYLRTLPEWPRIFRGF